MGRGRSSGAGAVSSRGERSAWRPTALQREYRQVLDLAKEQAQLIVDSDGTGLVVQLQSEAEFDRGLGEYVACVGRFLAVAKANAGRPAAEWASQTDFPYLAVFDADEVNEFRRELLAFTFDAAQRRTLRSLKGNLRAWESTAGIYGQPEVMTQMLADLDEDDYVEVLPPAEEAAAEDAR